MATQDLYFIPAHPLQNKNSLTADSTRTTWKDLNAVNISKNCVSEMFQTGFNEKPKAVYLNEGICITYGHLCHNVLGKISYGAQSTMPITKVAKSNKIYNDSGNKVDANAVLTASEYKSASVTITESSSLSFGSKITIGSEALGIAAEFSTQFTVENSVGSTSSSSTAVEVGDNIVVHLEPNSSAQVELDVQWTQMKENFTIPLTVSGMVGADFGHQVKGHNFWFLGLPSNLHSSLTGSVVTAYNIEGNTKITDL